MGNAAAEEEGHWDLNLGAAAVQDYSVLKEKREDHEVWGGEGRVPHGFGEGGREPRCFGRVGTLWRQHS